MRPCPHVATIDPNRNSCPLAAIPGQSDYSAPPALAAMRRSLPRMVRARLRTGWRPGTTRTGKISGGIQTRESCDRMTSAPGRRGRSAHGKNVSKLTSSSDRTAASGASRRTAPTAPAVPGVRGRHPVQTSLGNRGAGAPSSMPGPHPGMMVQQSSLDHPVTTASDREKAPGSASSGQPGGRRWSC